MRFVVVAALIVAFASCSIHEESSVCKQSTEHNTYWESDHRISKIPIDTLDATHQKSILYVDGMQYSLSLEQLQNSDNMIPIKYSKTVHWKEPSTIGGKQVIPFTFEENISFEGGLRTEDLFKSITFETNSTGKGTLTITGNCNPSEHQNKIEEYLVEEALNHLNTSINEIFYTEFSSI